ncbi:MAG: sensor histidine kinase, partial [Promethearchaeota archaeon]
DSIEPYMSYRVITKSGKLKWVEEYSKTILIQGKEALLVSIMDITEKKEAEQNLKESEEKFRTITEQSYMGILIIEDWSIKITYSNQKFADIIGYTREEIENWKIEDFFKIVHPEDVEHLVDLAKKKYETEIAVLEKYQFRIFKKTGKIVWLEIDTKSFPYGDGLAELISVIDITERILAEKSIKKSEKKYRHLFENAPYVIGLIDVKGNIIDFNETVSDFFPDSKKHDLVGKTVFEWIATSNKDKIPLFRKLLDEINKGEITDSIEMQINIATGDKIWINVHFSLLNIEDETLIQLIIQNITDKKEAEKLIIEENKKLLELDEIRKEMITRISHELKTPLTSIYGAIQILSESLRDQMNDNVLKFVDVIHRGSIRFKKLIENLLDISRMDSRKLELKAQQEDLSEIVNECVNEMIYLANNRGLKINLNFPHELLFELDKLRMEQAITNLISNAIKNTPMDGIISISLLDYKEYIDIRIEDTGVGLTPEEKLKLFKKFGKIERYGMDLDVDIEGIGLGLFISKEIVELHGGKILVESEGRNMGTTFTIRLFKN